MDKKSWQEIEALCRKHRLTNPRYYENVLGADNVNGEFRLIEDLNIPEIQKAFYKAIDCRWYDRLTSNHNLYFIVLIVGALPYFIHEQKYILLGVDMLLLLTFSIVALNQKLREKGYQSTLNLVFALLLYVWLAFLLKFLGLFDSI